MATKKKATKKKSEKETETIEYTRKEKPVLGLIETELKRVLDRRANPAIQELAGNRRFETNLSLTHYSNDKNVEGQPEVLLIYYSLGVETIEGDFKRDDQGNNIKTDWDDLWDRITDRFYGYDKEAGALLDMHEAIEYLNEINHDEFSGWDFQGFRELMSASGTPRDAWDSLQDKRTAERLASRPRAVSDDGPSYAEPEGFNLASKSVSEVIKATIALYAAQNNLPSVDPDKIDDHDVIFELLDRNDPVTLTCRKAFDLTYDLLASVPEPVFITVGNAIEWYEELLADREVNPIGDTGSSVITDREELLRALRDGEEYLLDDADPALLADREFILAALHQGGFGAFAAFDYADQSLKADRELVIEAVKQDGSCFEFASEELRRDRELLLELAEIDGDVLKYAEGGLQSDRELVLLAVSHGMGALGAADASLRSDREVVLAAVRYNGLALMHAADDLRADREIVLEAVQDFASALEYASDDLKNDRDIVLKTVRQSWMALEYASDDLKNDRDIVLEAVKQYGGALEYASEALQQDEELQKTGNSESGDP